MLGLTPLGTVHTAISLTAVVAGFVALWSYREISTGTRSGQLFVSGTGASRYSPSTGGLRRPLALRRDSRLLAHVLPLHSRHRGKADAPPAGAPYLANPDDPKAQPIIGVVFVLFLIGATLQVPVAKFGGYAASPLAVSGCQCAVF